MDDMRKYSKICEDGMNCYYIFYHDQIQGLRIDGSGYVTVYVSWRPQGIKLDQKEGPMLLSELGIDNANPS